MIVKDARAKGRVKYVYFIDENSAIHMTMVVRMRGGREVRTLVARQSVTNMHLSKSISVRLSSKLDITDQIISVTRRTAETMPTKSKRTALSL